MRDRLPLHGTRFAEGGVRLAWAVVEGELRPIAAFAGLPPGRRPAASCPVCNGRVHANLGTRKAHHFSHTPGADCAVRSGETALHLNTKFHIAEELRRGRILQILEPCAGHGGYLPCASRRTALFVRGWDTVRVERSLGTLRPDVLLERAGTPVAAIEVFATHEVPPEKARTLSGQGVPWIEVRADPALYAGDSPWSAATPLPALRRAPTTHWRCSSCRALLQEKERERQRREAELARRARLRRKAACVVDVYRPNGRGFREVIWWVTEVRDGVVVTAQLWKERRREVLAEVRVRPGGEHQARQALQQRFAAWLRYHARQGAHVDRVTGWVRAGELRDQDVDRVFRRRYRRDPTVGWVPVRRDAPPLPETFQRRSASPAPAPVEPAVGPPSSTPLRQGGREPEWPRRFVSSPAAADDAVARAGRLVDSFALDGTTRRRILWREVWQTENGWFSGVLYWSGTVRPFSAVMSPTAAECESALGEGFELAASVDIMAGVVLDSPMRWRAVDRIDPYLGFNFPLRYEWDAGTHQWLPRDDFGTLAWE